MSETKGEVESALGAGGKHEHSHEQLHACIGVSLVLGFVFMLLVDQIGSSHVHSTEGRYHSKQTSGALLFLEMSCRHSQNVCKDCGIGGSVTAALSSTSSSTYLWKKIIC